MFSLKWHLEGLLQFWGKSGCNRLWPSVQETVAEFKKKFSSPGTHQDTNITVGNFGQADFRMLCGTYCVWFIFNVLSGAEHKAQWVNVFHFWEGKKDTLLKVFPCSSFTAKYLWEFQSISLILHLSQECCVRNQNSPHILRIINFPAIAGEYTETAMWVKPCWKTARLWVFANNKVCVLIPMPKLLFYLMWRSNLVISGCQGFILIKVQGLVWLFH